MGTDNREISWTLNAVDRATTVFKSIETGMGGLQSAWGNIQRTIAGGVAGDFMLKIVEHTKEAEQAATRLEAILRNTGATAGFTRDELDGMAGALAKSTQFDDQAIKKAAAEILIFGKIHGDTFKQALKLSTDVAAFWGTDLPSAARDVAKALAEPETAFKLLKSAGVTLTDQQKDQIKHMGALGDLAGQQRVILEQLSKAYRGVAEEMNTGFTHATAGAAKAWDDLLIALGKTPAAHTAVQESLGYVEQHLRDMKKIVEDGDWTHRLLDIFTLAAHGGGSATPFPIQLLGGLARGISQALPNAPDGRRASGKIGGLPGLDSGQSDAEYAAAKIARAQAFGLSEIDLGTAQAAMAAELRVLDDAHKDGLVSEEHYYSDRRKLIEQNLVAELTAVQAGMAAQRAIIEHGGSAQEIATAQLALAKLKAQQSKAILGADTEKTLVAAEKRRAELARGATEAKALAETYTQLGVRIDAADQALADFNETRSLDDQSLTLQTDLLTKSSYQQGLLTKNREIDLQVEQAIKKLGADQVDQMVELYAAGERAKAQAKDLYDINYAAAKSWETGVAKGLDTYFEEVTNHAQQMENLVSHTFHGMEDALVTFVTTGKLSFKSLADSIVADITRIIIQQTIMKPLTTAAGTSGLAGLLGLGGSPYNSGGAGGSAWVASADLPMGPIGMAAGGDFLVTRPTLFLAGEAGPERATFSGANRASGRGGGMTNIFNFAISGPINSASQSQIAAAAADGLQRAALRFR